MRRMLLVLTLILASQGCVHAPKLEEIEVPPTVPVELRDKYRVFAREAQLFSSRAVVAMSLDNDATGTGQAGSTTASVSWRWERIIRPYHRS